MKKIVLLVYGILFLTCALGQKKGASPKFSKAFNGLYILNDQFNNIFPLADIEYTNVSIAASLQKRSFYHAAYVVIVNYFFPGTNDLIALKDFIKEGNDVFIFAAEFNSTTKDYFDFDTHLNYLDSSNKISLKAYRQDTLGYFESNRLKGFLNQFTSYDTNKTKVLGFNDNGLPNFIKITYGTGALYIHLYPEIVLNYFLVEKNNYIYTEAALSVLPRNLNKVMVKLVRNESSRYEGEEKEDNDLLQFIKNDPNLWTAFLLGLGLFGLLILFGLKKRQRVIPVQEPVRNKTLEFTKTMGDLYFNQKNNTDIAHKKIVFWQEHVRSKYQIPTHKLDAPFWEKLQKKSGAATELIQRLQKNIAVVKNQGNIPDKVLMHLSNDIDQFNKI